MTQEKDPKEIIAGLRQRAEEAVTPELSDSEGISSLSPEEVQRLVHELRVHQIELEMQNEDLRQAQVKLEELKDRYFDLYDFAPVGYVTLNDKGLILEANLTAVRLLGIERQRLIEKPFSRFVCKEFGDAYYLHLQHVLETQSKQTCEIKLVREDGTQFYAQLESIAVQDEGGEFTRCRTIVTDISERKRVEEALRESEERYRSFFDTSHDGVMITAVDGRLIDFNESAMEMLGYSVSDRAEMLDKDIGMFYANPDEREAHRDLVTTLGFSVDYPVDLRRQDDTVIHTLITVVARTGSHGKDMGFYWTVQDITERKKAEEVLRQSEGRNRFLAEVIENSSQPFGTGYPDGRLGIVNRAFCDLTGYTEEELRHIDWNVTLTPPEWLESEIQHLTELERTGKPVRYEKEYIRKDGTRVPIELLVHVVRGETGETLHYQAFLTDLTERKKAEKELKESEQRFRIIFDRAPLGIALVGLDYRLLMANKAYCDLLGYSEDELRQLQLSDFTHPDDLEENLRLQRELGSTKISSFQMEKRFIRKDGQISLGLLVASLLSDDSGIPKYFIGLVLDITDRKKAEEAVRVSEERFRLAMEATADGVWDWDLKTDNVFRSPGFFSMLGYQEEELRGHFGEWQDLVHPEDLEAVRCALEEYLAGTRENYEVEFRMFEKSGGTVWILSRGKVVARDESGRPLRMVGTHSDITERKRSEGELQENENRLKRISSMVSDIAYSCFKQPSGAYSIDWMTGGVENLTGYSVDDLKSLGCWRYLVVDEDLPVFDTHVIGLAPGTTGSCELRLRHKTGEIVWISSFAECVVEQESLDSRRLYGGLVDITDRKHAEEKLIRSQSQLSNALEIASLGHWEYDLTKDLFTFNDHFYKIFRTSVEHVGGYTMSSADYARRFVHPDDMGMVADEIRKAIETNDPHFTRQMEHRILYADGEIGHISVRHFVVKDDFGRTVKTFGVNQDITDRKRGEELLVRANQEWERTFNSISDLIIILDSQHKILRANKAMLDALGRTKQETIGKACYELVHGTESPPSFCPHSKLLCDGQEHEEEVLEPRLCGTYDIRVSPLVNSKGNLIGSIHVSRDITIKKQIEAKLLAGASLLKTVLSTAPVGIGLAKDRRFEWVNEYLSEMTGYSEEELVGQGARILYETDEEFERVGEVVYGRIRSLGTGSVETRWRRKDGSLIQVFASASAVDPQDLSAGVVFSSTDISAQKKAMDEIQRSHGETKSLLNGTKALLEYRHFQDSARGLFDICTAAIGATAGYVALLSEDGAENEVLFLESGGVPCSVDPSLPMPIRGLRAEAYRTGKVVYENDFLHSQWMEFMPDGHADLENVLFAPLVVEGKAVGLLGMANKEGGFNEADARIAKAFADLASIGLLNSRNMDALEESEERTRLLIESSPIGVRIAQDCKLLYVNPAFLHMFGYDSEDEVIGLHVEDLYTIESKESVLSGLRRPSHYEAVAMTKAGNKFSVEIWSAEMTFQGKRSSLAFVIDVSEARRLRSQLFQAQKMEAIGTLTGGIAHDFNNILQVVCGFSEIILTGKEKGDPEYEDLAKVLSAGQKGADLVQRLLTFSRKSEINPKPVNLNQQIQRVESILERTIPKTIKIDLALANGLSAITADPTQIEQILMNLSINARDAMPEGGRLILETSNVTLDEDYCSAHLGSKPGHYVLLTVSDTGEGMDKKTLEHIFEPFFSTKPSGKGTGLGLAMVYGIVKQHDGYITCYSEPGVGTTFKLYFPVTEMQDDSIVRHEEKRLPVGSETILLVDDEELIRDLAKRILSRAGYTVLTAANGREAFQTYNKKRQGISLIVLDLIMPEMDGKHCLKELLKINPGARVLVASGYSADGPAKEALESGAKGFVSKPFDMGQLLQTVRKVLDED